MKFHKIHDFCGFSGPARPGPPPRPRAVGEHTRKLRIPSAPLTGARAGIRPRADGNPAPSRRKSGPEPTEILPRFRSPPPLLKTYLTHFPFGSEASLPPSLQLHVANGFSSPPPTLRDSSGCGGGRAKSARWGRAPSKNHLPWPVDH